MAIDQPKPNSGRKLFFGLFVFPLLIAVGMAVLLCSVIFLTHEQETPESLIAAIKTGSSSKRWQKAFELSNELNRGKSTLRNDSILREIIFILRDPARYDAKTRSYMAIALSHFQDPAAVQALRLSLKDQNQEVALYALWALGALGAKESADDIAVFLENDSDSLRKMAAYVLGALGNHRHSAALKKLLSDPVMDVRWNAALSLARLGDDSGLEVLLKMLDRQWLETQAGLSQEAIEEIMTSGSKGLALISNQESIKILEIVSQNDKSLKVRQAAISALKLLKKTES
jgi:HEAT repeat protein